jgi:integrase
MGRKEHDAPWRLRKHGESPCWNVRFSVPGKGQIERSTGERTRGKAAKRAAEIYREETQAGARHPTVTDSQLATATAQWIIHLGDLGKHEEWIPTLEIYARAHWCPRWPKVSDITTDAITGYVVERLAAVEPDTVRKELSALRKFCEYAKSKAMLVDMPTFAYPEGKSDVETPVLTVGQVKAVLAKMPTRKEHRKGHPVREYYTVMYWCALRKGHMSRITWADADLAAGSFRIRHAADKASNARVVPLPKPAVKALKSMGKDRVGLIFGDRDYAASLKKAAKDAGVPEDIREAPRFSNHVLRHSRLTHLADAGATITELKHISGHKTLASLQKYLRASERAARTLLKRLKEL